MADGITDCPSERPASHPPTAPKVPGADDPDEDGVAFSSTMVFQAPHPGHLPIHPEVSCPHSEQKKDAFDLAIYQKKDPLPAKSCIALNISGMITAPKIAESTPAIMPIIRTALA